MKLRGFQLANVDLEVGEEVYDLHNNFDSRGFNYEIDNRELTLRWVCGTGDWVPKDSPSEIIISVRGVSYLAASPRDPDLPYSEDDCLDCVLFVEPTQATDECFITAAPVTPELHYVFQFMSGFMLRVQADEALCKIG